MCCGGGWALEGAEPNEPFHRPSGHTTTQPSSIEEEGFEKR